MTRTLQLGGDALYRRLVGVGGIGAGLFFALQGNHDLGRNESRPARRLDVRDYCKLHITLHYPAVLCGASADAASFHVLPLGKVGRDEAAQRLRGEMDAAGMDTRLVASVDEPTLLSICFQYPDGSGGNFTTTTDSAAARLTPADVDQAAAWLDARTIALAAPEVPLEARRRLLALATQKGALRVASFATAEVEEARSTGLLAEVDLLALNEDEAAALAGESLSQGGMGAFLERCAWAALALQPRVRLVVSAGERGAYAFDGSGWTHVPALPVSVASTAGAGDALLGGTLAGLAAGLAFLEAVRLGALVAAYKVTSPHTIPPAFSLDALARFARAERAPLSAALVRLVLESGA